MPSFSTPGSPSGGAAPNATRLAKDGARQICREQERLVKVDPEHRTFKPFQGLTFIAMMPTSLQEQLHEKVDFLKHELTLRGLLDRFLFTPPDTYHITLQGVGDSERVLPDTEQDEVDRYFAVGTAGIMLPSGGVFDVEVKEFGKYSDLAIWLRATAVTVPPFVNTLKANLQASFSKGDFHITVAYYVNRLSEEYQKRRLSAALDEATRKAFTPPCSPVIWKVDHAAMYHFPSMEYYEKIPGSDLI